MDIWSIGVNVGVFCVTGILSYIFKGKIDEKTFNIETSSKISEMLLSFRSPVRVPKKDRRNSIILLGLGGSGKTSLIRALVKDKNANPDEKTETYEIYHGSRTTSEKMDETNVWFYISDYKGQNVGQLIRSFIGQQNKPNSPMAYGFVTSLLFIVDLWPPEEVRQVNTPTKSKCHAGRINEHLSQWNETALDAMFGLITNETKLVALFINKLDIMADQSNEAKNLYKEKYSELVNRLKTRSGDITFKTYLGSAESGTAINHLEEDLIRLSDGGYDGE